MTRRCRWTASCAPSSRPPEWPRGCDRCGRGLMPRVKASAIRVDRASSEIWGGELLGQALGRGYSLDQLNLGAGDRLFVSTRAIPSARSES
jgi:hypothetical protein